MMRFRSRQKEGIRATAAEQHLPAVENVELKESRAEPLTHAETPGVEAVVELLTQKRLRRPRGMLTWIWNVFSPLLALALLWNFTYGNLGWQVAIGLLLATILRLNRLSTALEQSGAAFETYEAFDSRWIGALIEALDWPHARVQAVARLQLTRLLPKATAEAAVLLTEDQRARLFYKLTVRNAARHPEFVIAILQSLPSIGHPEALPYVERLTKLHPFNHNRRRIRKAARACIPLLETRVEPEYIALQTAGIDANEPELSQRQQPRPLEALNPQTGQKEPKNPLSSPGMRLPFLLASWCVIVPYTAYQTFVAFAQGAWMAGAIFAVLTLLGTQLYRLTLTQKRRYQALDLGKTEDLQEVGRLAEELEWPDPEIRSSAIRALTRLLPHLKASDSALLNAKQRECLYRMLDLENAHRHVEFLIAVLRALEQVGDPEAAPFVEQLANSPVYTKQQQQVQQQARECLPYLQERAEQNQLSQSLLRASAAESAPTELLLRPSSERSEHDQQQLLRSTESNPQISQIYAD